MTADPESTESRRENKSPGPGRGRPLVFDITHQRFGRLYVLRRVPGGGPKWACVCDCGRTKAIAGSSLRKGLTRSCGCLLSEVSSAKAIPVADRFWTKVVKSEGCWLWTGATNEDGYGQIVAKKELGEHAAHRVAWVLAYGPVPDGMQVLHECDTPPCVRPDHLFLGTQADNIADMVRKGRRRGPLGEMSPRTRLTEADVIAIRAASGTLREIGERFGLTFSGVWSIKHRKCWRHVP